MLAETAKNDLRRSSKKPSSMVLRRFRTTPPAGLTPSLIVWLVFEFPDAHNLFDSKWIVAGLFGSVLLLRHDGAALWAVVGSVSNSALSVALKRLLNQERPVATLRSDPGMPSSHAQSISFISVFTVLSVMEWLGTNVLSLFLSGLVLALGSYFTWLRVSQKLHTTSQVVVGAIVGSVYSTLWYVTWNSFVFEAFTSSFSVQVPVFLVAAASALGFAVYVLLNWFKDDR
ncbi:PREDICTED: lipid phosphate phosphatase epsilon 2, chloroplastic isoform X3 [Camelina sativa]|uniref:Lipid phosphate phosphatase epsilon 2, chloroplastic isoform X3 n=1 Tax=Camelina sativa TaxID=90675 RepID=A0ABM1QP72_CAMSA|nr:PREDICTED: lipid phosphate phosphatase epsilon 2, chloroplastic isoform X3 [Camelina sativa]